MLSKIEYSKSVLQSIITEDESILNDIFILTLSNIFDYIISKITKWFSSLFNFIFNTGISKIFINFT